MNKAIYFLALFFPLVVLGKTWDQQDLVSFLRRTPAYVVGNVYTEKPFTLSKASGGLVQVKMRPKGSVGYRFDENQLHLFSQEALIIKIGGIITKVRSVSYSKKTGEIEVKTSTPLGIGQKSLNDKVAKELEAIFKPRLKKAFAKLEKLRKEKTLGDVRNSVSYILEVLDGEEEGPPLKHPTLNGSFDLVYIPQKDTKIKFNQFTAEALAEDQIQAGFHFEKSMNKFNISEVHLNSFKSMRIYPKTKTPELKSIAFSALSLDSKGLNMNMNLAPEEILGGLLLTLGMVGMHITDPNCPPPLLMEGLRQDLQAQFGKEVDVILRQYYPDLIKAGVNPQLLKHLTDLRSK